MKNCNEMANEVFRRREEYEMRQKQKRKTFGRVAVSLAAVCLAVLLGIGVSQSGLLHGGIPFGEDRDSQSTASAEGSATASDQTDGSVLIPAIQLPEAPAETAFDMIGLVVYKGSIYTQTEAYYGTDARNLVGERLGYATGNINEWSKQEDYAADFASTVSGEVYSVKGYSTDFRLCLSYDTQDENGEPMQCIQFMERLNGISLTCGKDLFGDRLQIRGRIAAVQYRTHEDWDSAENNYRDLSDLTAEQINAFVDGLYAGGFEYVYEANPDFYNDSDRKQVHLYFRLDDGTVTELRLIEGGYVGYQGLSWYFVKMPGDAFDSVFYACR